MRNGERDVIRRKAMPTAFKRIVRGIKKRTVEERPLEWFFRRLPRHSGEIWFTPKFPESPMYAVYKLTAHLGLQIGRARTSVTLAAFSWNDATYCDPITAEGLRVINGHCTDISKQRVEIEFAKAFGYPLAVDPISYSGKAIWKSNENAVHRGGVIDCPIAAKDPALSYEVLIDSKVTDDLFEELRIPIIGDEIPLLYVKINPVAHRFANWINGCAMTEDVGSFISPQERSSIMTMMRAMGADYAEIDALRDRHSGRMYVIDVNKTPAGPPTPLSITTKMRSVKIMAPAFARMIENATLD